jgi:hypothetical protein
MHRDGEKGPQNYLAPEPFKLGLDWHSFDNIQENHKSLCTWDCQGTWFLGPANSLWCLHGLHPTQGTVMKKRIVSIRLKSKIQQKWEWHENPQKKWKNRSFKFLYLWGKVLEKMLWNRKKKKMSHGQSSKFLKTIQVWTMLKVRVWKALFRKRMRQDWELRK